MFILLDWWGILVLDGDRTVLEVKKLGLLDKDVVRSLSHNQSEQMCCHRYVFQGEGDDDGDAEGQEHVDGRDGEEEMPGLRGDEFKQVDRRNILIQLLIIITMQYKNIEIYGFVGFPFFLLCFFSCWSL